MEFNILYSKCLFAILIGVVGHTWKAYKEQEELFARGNVSELSFMEFIKKKPSSHIVNLICSLFWLLLLPDAAKAVPTIRDSVYLANIVHIVGCAVAGWGGSSFLLSVLGKGTKYALDIVDKKTNIADGK
jgi:hypothetical protein